MSSASKFYFAYGSNMLKDRFYGRCKGARQVDTASLYGWELRFDVYGEQYGGLTASIHRADPDSVVQGVLYEISESDEVALNKIESPAYLPEKVTVKTSKGQEYTDVVVYVAKPEILDNAPDTRISMPYLQIMLDGAKENNLTRVIEQLETVSRS